jgi:hypothetical protein
MSSAAKDEQALHSPPNGASAHSYSSLRRAPRLRRLRRLTRSAVRLRAFLERSDDGCGDFVPATHYTPVSTVTIVATHVHSGAHAVKIAAGGILGVMPPRATFFGRAWVYFGASPGSNHWAFVESVGPGTQGTANAGSPRGQPGHVGLRPAAMFETGTPCTAPALAPPSQFAEGKGYATA